MMFSPFVLYEYQTCKFRYIKMSWRFCSIRRTKRNEKESGIMISKQSEKKNENGDKEK